jgi:hypothetical protein
MPMDRPLDMSYDLTILLPNVDNVILLSSIVLASNRNNTSSIMLTLVTSRNFLCGFDSFVIVVLM